MTEIQHYLFRISTSGKHQKVEQIFQCRFCIQMTPVFDLGMDKIMDDLVLVTHYKNSRGAGQPDLFPENFICREYIGIFRPYREPVNFHIRGIIPRKQYRIMFMKRDIFFIKSRY